MVKNINGVDLSVWQHGIDHKALAADGVKFAIIRAGIKYSVDTSLEEHAKGCLAAGIDVGYYWYSYATTSEEARREARECVKAIAKFPLPKYPVFFDAECNDVAEALGKTAMTDVALAFIKEIEDSGYPAGVYANPSWMECEYNKADLIEKTDIWLAHWTWNPDKPSKFDYDQTMWQWGIIKGKSVNGAAMDVDADICFVDYPAITAEFYAGKDKKTVEDLAVEVIGGLWGNGVDRKERLTNAGYDYDEVQGEVNRILAENSAANKKSADELAIEVIQGKWGNGQDRKDRLTAAGYDYEEVQRRVDELLGG